MSDKKINDENERLNIVDVGFGNKRLMNDEEKANNSAETFFGAVGFFVCGFLGTFVFPLIGTIIGGIVGVFLFIWIYNELIKP
jgi:hypothetical protein